MTLGAMTRRMLMMVGGDDKENGWDDLLEEDPNNYGPDYNMEI
jgi:hypothetical protein